MNFTELLTTEPINRIAQKHNELFLIGSYSIGNDGISKCTFTVDEDGNRTIDDRKPVCSKPILPVAIYDNQDEQLQKVEVAMWSMNRWKRIVVCRSVLTNKNKIVQLADNGFPIGSDNAGYVAKYFLSFLSDYDEQLTRRTSRTSMGWCDTDDGKVFMPYTDSVAFDGEDTYSYLYHSITSNGDKQKWLDMMRKLRKNIPIRMMMAGSFASPLVELIGENPFVVHLFAPTGQGKTVALMVAASIWGDPNNGKMVRSLNMTMNSMLSTASFLNNLPFFGDELQTLKSRWNKSYDQIVMQLCEGIDRGRMNNAVLIKSKSWRNAFIFTGEDPIIKESSGGGTVNRVVQIEAEGKIVQNGNATANFVRANYGLVGEDWTRYISELDDLTERYNELFQLILSESDTTDKQAGAMAILMLADRLASELFWMTEPELKLSDISKYLASSKQVDIAERAWDFLVNTIAEQHANFEDNARNRFGFIDGRTVWFNKGALQRVLSDSGYDFDAIKKRWKDSGHLEVKIVDGKEKYAWYKSMEGATAYYVQLNVPNELEEFSEVDGDELPF